jgi:hypothetical protein
VFGERTGSRRILYVTEEQRSQSYAAAVEEKEKGGLMQRTTIGLITNTERQLICLPHMWQHQMNEIVQSDMCVPQWILTQCLATTNKCRASVMLSSGSESMALFYSFDSTRKMKTLVNYE